MKPDRQICSPLVNSQTNGLQRAAASWIHFFRCLERWLSPDGGLRAWLRHNARIGAWLLIPAVVVMPVVGLILWQLTGWLAMLTSIAGRLVVLPVLALLSFAVIKIVTAFIRR